MVVMATARASSAIHHSLRTPTRKPSTAPVVLPSTVELCHGLDRALVGVGEVGGEFRLHCGAARARFERVEARRRARGKRRARPCTGTAWAPCASGRREPHFVGRAWGLPVPHLAGPEAGEVRRILVDELGETLSTKSGQAMRRTKSLSLRVEAERQKRCPARRPVTRSAPLSLAPIDLVAPRVRARCALPTLTSSRAVQRRNGLFLSSLSKPTLTSVAASDFDRRRFAARVEIEHAAARRLRRGRHVVEDGDVEGLPFDRVLRTGATYVTSRYSSSSSAASRYMLPAVTHEHATRRRSGRSA